jgi:hypothetical protein
MQLKYHAVWKEYPAFLCALQGCQLLLLPLGGLQHFW